MFYFHMPVVFFASIALVVQAARVLRFWRNMGSGDRRREVVFLVTYGLLVLQVFLSGKPLVEALSNVVVITMLVGIVYWLILGGYRTTWRPR